MAYKRLLGQLYQKRDAYTEILTQLLSVNYDNFRPLQAPYIKNFQINGRFQNKEAPKMFWKLQKATANCLKTQSKSSVKELLFSKVAGFQHTTLQKNELLHSYFSRILSRFSEHLFYGTSLNGCFHITPHDYTHSGKFLQKFPV